MYTVDTLTHEVKSLTSDEQERLFELLTNHSDLIEKIIPGLPLVDHIANGTEYNDPLVERYKTWKNNR